MACPPTYSSAARWRLFQRSTSEHHGSTERNSGDSVPVVITQGKVTSPPVTEKPCTYEHWYRINAGFEQVLDSLKALRKHRPLDAGEIDRFRELGREARAVTNSYLAGVVERAETKKAGRLFRDRLRREKTEENLAHD